MSRPATSNGETLSRCLDSARVIVCAGTGGVGKTTIAAALAVSAARRGRKTLVLTVDPARRLADALGVSGLDSAPRLVPLPAENGETLSGRLEAMVLDPKPTFDRLVHRLTEDPDARERILGNRIYQHLSEALAGSAEYAAMEQVHEAVTSERYDLVVVDTPPSSHALDFLAAPRRLRAFLEGRFVRALVRPAMSASRLGFRVFGRALHRMLGLIERIAGVGFLDDLSEFLSAIDGLSEGFRERASRVEEILQGDTTRFLLIGGARSGSEPGALEFLDALSELDVELSAIVLNRVRPWPLETSAAGWLASAEGAALDADQACLHEALARAVGPERAGEWADSLVGSVRESAAARADAEQTQTVFAEHVTRGARGGAIPCHVVYERPQEVDRLAGLVELGESLLQETGS